MTEAQKRKQSIAFDGTLFSWCSLFISDAPCPGKKILIPYLTGGHAKACLNHIIVGAVHMNAVDLKESQHDIHANPLVAIHKGMVGDQRIAQPCAFLFLGGGG